jgi:hypothetical protein
VGVGPDVAGSTSSPAAPLSVLSATTTTAQQGVPTGSILLATFTQKTLQPASAYTAFVDWGDNSADLSTDVNLKVTVVVAGNQIHVYGTHTYATTGAQSVTVALLLPGNTSALANATINVTVNSLGNDVTSQVHTQSSGFVYNRGTKQFYGSLTVTNTSAASIPGSLNILLGNLTSGVTLTGASVTIGSITFQLSIAFTNNGDPYVILPQSVLAGLASGQSLKISLTFSDPSLAAFGYNPKVFSDP